MKKTPAETLIRHRQYRELFETFTLFFSLALLLLCAGTLMIKIQAPPFLIVMAFVFALPCFVASVLKSICYFAHWVEQVGLPEDRNAYSVVLRQIAKMRMKSIFVAASLLALAFPTHATQSVVDHALIRVGSGNGNLHTLMTSKGSIKPSTRAISRGKTPDIEGAGKMCGR